jgi:DNA-binding transcriptional MerR regulator
MGAEKAYSDPQSNVIRAFSASHVVRLTGLSHSQLRYWDDTGFFRPRYAFENRRSPFSRVYSFQDVVGLKTISHLRKVHRIPLQQLRRVARKLSSYRDRPWSELILYVLGKEVYFREPETEQVRGVLSGQYTLVHLESIIHDLSAEAEKLKQRSPEQFGRLERHRFVVHNAWVIAGTRIPTRAIWRFHQAGYSADKIIREYPPLTRADVLAALKHEEKLAAHA